MCHIPSSLVADGEFPLELFGRDAFFGGADQVDSKEPLGQRQMRIMEDGTSGDGKLVLAVHALVEMPGLAGFAGGIKLGDACAATAEALHTQGPANLGEMSDARGFGAKLV